jgi:hypothetical protein
LIVWAVWQALKSFIAASLTGTIYLLNLGIESIKFSPVNWIYTIELYKFELNSIFVRNLKDMKKITLALCLFFLGIAAYSQTYNPVTSKNKTYLATIKGITYSYKNGVITLKNNGNYDLGTVTINAYSKVDSTLFGIALFEEGLERGKIVKADVYFTGGLGNDSHDLSLKQVDQKNLVFSFDKATRALR